MEMQRRFPLSSAVKMARSQKSKRVSWAPDMSLRQVRLFLSEDAPSQSGLGAQDLLQAKTSWLWHSPDTDPDDQLPPGFEGPQPSWQLKKEIFQLPVIKWQCPPSFELNPDWQVVAGEESKEVGVQNQRELRVLEAVYPRPSAIPPSPSSPEVEEHHHNNLYTLLIPITPVEDDEAADSLDTVAPTESLFETWQKPRPPRNLPDSGAVCQFPALRSMPEPAQGNIPSVSKLPMNEKPAATIVPGVEQDVAEAAASVVFTAIMTSNKEGNLIDRDLLIKILKNPKLMEELVREHGTATAPQPHTANSEALSIAVSMPGLQHRLPPPVHVSRPEPDMAVPTANPSTEHSYARPTLAMHTTDPCSGSLVMAKTSSVPPVKDLNYYKSLIQQHGEEKQGVRDLTRFGYSNNNCHGQKLRGASPEISQSSSRQRDLRTRIQKPCVYYNSSRGCWHGANCIYLHDGVGKREICDAADVQSSKRIKMEREITGRS